MKFVTKTELKRLGFSEKLITELLGPPDSIKLNPRRRSGPRIQLWAPDRVEQARQDARFTQYQIERQRRSAATRVVMERKRLEVLQEIESMEIHVPRFPIDEIMEESSRDWTEWRRGNGDFAVDGSCAPETNKERWAVNYIRHCLTSYDCELEKLAGKVAVVEGVSRIRERIYEAIAKLYPELKFECERQLYRRQELELFR